MNNTGKEYSGGLFPILTAILILTFWILFALLLPMQDPYINWIQNTNWTWINIIGFLGSLFGVFALNAIFSHISIKRKTDYLGFGIGLTGIIMLTSILFFEAFILKGIALENPDLIDLNNSFYQYPTFKIANLSAGILLSTGIILLGIRMLALKTFKMWKVIVLMIACPLFGIVVIPANLRLLGVLLYAASFFAIGIEIINKTDSGKT